MTAADWSNILPGPMFDYLGRASTFSLCPFKNVTVIVDLKTTTNCRHLIPMHGDVRIASSKKGVAIKSPSFEMFAQN